MFPLEIHLYFPQLQSKEDTLLSYDLFLQQNLKKKVKPMLGFFSLKSARATLAGIELHHMLRKRQFKFKSHLPIWEQFSSLAG